MPEFSAEYQMQITGRPAGWVYKVKGVKFDGFKDGTLLEVKGHYKQFARIDPLLTGWREGANSKREAIEQPLVTTEHTDLV